MTTLTQKIHPLDVLGNIQKRVEVLFHALLGLEESASISDAFAAVASDLSSDLETVIHELNNPDGVTDDLTFKEARIMFNIPNVMWDKGENCYCTIPNNDRLITNTFRRGFAVPILTQFGFTFKIVSNDFEVLSPEKALYFNTLGDALKGGQDWFKLKFAESPVKQPDSVAA